MPTVVADAGPLHYLILIQQTDILRALFGRVVVPDVVMGELRRENTPSEVRRWIEARPDWLVEQAAPSVTPDRFAQLGSGEAGVLSLAASLPADLVLIDDRDARKACAGGRSCRLGDNWCAGSRRQPRAGRSSRGVRRA